MASGRAILSACGPLTTAKIRIDDVEGLTAATVMQPTVAPDVDGDGRLVGVVAIDKRRAAFCGTADE